LIVAEHHIDDIWGTDWTGARASGYGVSGIPHVRFDGKYAEIGSGDCLVSAEAYRSWIEQRLAETGGVSPVRIEGHCAISGSTLTISAVFHLLDPVALNNPRAILLVLADSLVHEGTTYDHITRIGREYPVVLEHPGSVAWVSTQMLFSPDRDIADFDFIALLQAGGGDQEIYQTARLRVATDFACRFDPAVASAVEGNATVELEGSVSNIGTMPEALTFSLDDEWGWPATFRVQGDAGFHHDPVTRVLAPGQGLDLAVRVTTDGARRIGTGCFVVRSATSGRSQPTPLRVFNGSPAILVVDADGGHQDEALVLSALEESGYLSQCWDADGAHDGMTPGFDDMHGFDVVVWHHGWQTIDLEPPQVAALIEYIATGGGLVLSSQDGLDYLPPGTFTHDYLGLGGWNNDTGASRAIGTPGDPVGDGIDAPLSYAYPQFNRADDLIPNEFGTVVLSSDDSRRIAVRADNGSTRAVVLAFCLNAMDPALPDPSNPKALLARSIEWVRQASGQGIAADRAVPVGAAVTGILPNPFLPGAGGGGAVTIRLRVPPSGASGPAQLDLFDLNGRRVRRLLDRRVSPGFWEQTWDGRDAEGRWLEAGVYQVRFTTSNGRCDARLVLLR
jgi:hypothetical protein